MLAKTVSKRTDLSSAYTDSQGGFFIDRDGKRFAFMLYLQAQAFDLPTARSDCKNSAELLPGICIYVHAGCIAVSSQAAVSDLLCTIDSVSLIEVCLVNNAAMTKAACSVNAAQRPCLE